MKPKIRLIAIIALLALPLTTKAWFYVDPVETVCSYNYATINFGYLIYDELNNFAYVGNSDGWYADYCQRGSRVEIGDLEQNGYFGDSYFAGYGDCYDC